MVSVEIEYIPSEHCIEVMNYNELDMLYDSFNNGDNYQPEVWDGHEFRIYDDET